MTAFTIIIHRDGDVSISWDDGHRPGQATQPDLDDALHIVRAVARGVADPLAAAERRRLALAQLRPRR